MSNPKLDRPPARKRWGQNFLVDNNMVDRIVRAVNPQQNDHFIEIGPGHGELTRPLAESGARITAVDIDPLLIDDLRASLPVNVTIIHGDILDANLPELLGEGARIYGSLPYNITSPIIFNLLKERHRWTDAHFIMQKEVGERMGAIHGSKVYGRLSVMVQALAEVERCFVIPPTVFQPQPKVDSVLMRIIPKLESGITDPRLFETVVRLAFGQRRKKLSNALKSLDQTELLQTHGLNDLRAERVSVEQYVSLANEIAASE